MGADQDARSPAASIIALIGPSGAGKSEVGRRLARLLGRPFVDTDREVVSRDGRTISRIFSEETEHGFRVLEAKAVAKAAATPGAVVSCGGGAVLLPSNVEALRSAGVVIYLKVSPQAAASRLGRAEGRPLLEGGSVYERVTELIRRRDALYTEAAHHVVDADAQAGEVAQAIASLLTSAEEAPAASGR